ncbi:MAG: hypothetical protein WAU88_02955 [Candidatus Zixiibacteriota bacterium]
MRKLFAILLIVVLLFAPMAVPCHATAGACDNISFNPEANWLVVFRDLIDCLGGTITGFIM